jgi:hypothetical protein
MVRIRSIVALSLLAFGASGALVLGGCKKEEKKDTPASGEKSGTQAEKPGDPGMGKTQAIPSGGTADDLSLLPVDSEVVMGLNFAQLQQSQLWKQFVEPQLMKGDVQQKLGEFKSKCGFDPMSSIKSISIGMKGVGGDKPDGVVVVHGADKAKSLACLDTMKADAAKEGSEIKRDGDVVMVKAKDGEDVALMFVNDSTAVAVIGSQANPDGVKKAAAGGSALKTSAAFVDMYGKIKTSDSLWLLVNGNSKAFDKAAAMGFKPKAVFGSINVTDGLTLDMRVRLDSADQAATMANTFRGQAAAAAAMVDKLDITNDGADVKVSVLLSNQKLQNLIKNFGSMLGGAMGGM